MRLPVLMLFAATVAQADVVPLHKLNQADRAQRIQADLQSVKIYRDGLKTVTEFAAAQTNLFPTGGAAESHLPRRHEKEVLWQIWKSYLDYLVALDGIERYYRHWVRLSGKEREEAFGVGYAAFLAKYRFSLDLIDDIERNPMLDTILNDPVPELGLPARTYARVKFRYLNGGTATEFGARSLVKASMRSGAAWPLRADMDEDADALLKMGRGRGELLTIKNALKIVQKAGDSAWLPIQTGVAEWMGDTRVYRTGNSLISPSQIRDLKLQPGDVLLVRREWYVSNVGLPGFWPHAALYIGTPQERRDYFSDPAVTAWAKAHGAQDFEALLQAREKAAYADSLQLDEKMHPPRVLEAISEGVSFTTIEHCADGDSLVVLRPMRPKTEKAIALLRAFHYAGRPYDFSFDFATDAKLVCTELVFKAYEPSPEGGGLRLPLVEMLGRKLLPANEIVRQFDSQYGTEEAQFEFVAFLDGYERGRKAVPASVDQFRQSWRRPKWHVLTQKVEE